jgi:hypothetical protein
MSNTMILAKQRQASRTSSALSSCSSSFDEQKDGAESSQRYSTWLAAVGWVDAVGDAAGTQHGEVGQHPFDDVLASTLATSPGSRPRATSPIADLRADFRTSFQVQARQMPRSFSRIRACRAFGSTPVQKISGMVSTGNGFGFPPKSSPRTSDADRGWWCSSPGLLLLPAAFTANAGFLHAEVELLDVVLFAQHRAGVFHHDAAVLEHVAVSRRR